MEKYKKHDLVCTSITKAGEPDVHGNQYYWIGFQDNTSGLFGCKTQDLFTLGEPQEFYTEQKVGKSGKEYSKIRRVKDIENPYENNQKKSSTGDPGGSTNRWDGRTKEDLEQMTRGVCVKAVCQMRAQSSRTMEQVIEEAEQLFDYIQFGIKDEPKDGHTQALQPPSSEIITDELPF